MMAQPIIGLQHSCKSVVRNCFDSSSLRLNDCSISLSLASFAFIGVEIPAATALEARISPNLADGGRPVDKSVQFSAIWVSVIVGLIYTVGVLLVSFNLKWNDPQLPRLSWLPSSNGTSDSVSGSESTTHDSSSPFVIAARNSAISGHQKIANFINVCILITALTAANTTLYVASRTLFSITKGIEANPSSPWITRVLSSFGQTNHRRVPMRALAASCCFCWVPFLYLSKSNAPGTTIGAVSAPANVYDVQRSDVGFSQSSCLKS